MQISINLAEILTHACTDRNTLIAAQASNDSKTRISHLRLTLDRRTP
jgi:hypothetical protein